jgi:hypothetical protein
MRVGSTAFSSKLEDAVAQPAEELAIVRHEEHHDREALRPPTRFVPLQDEEYEEEA